MTINAVHLIFVGKHSESYKLVKVHALTAKFSVWHLCSTTANQHVACATWLASATACNERTGFAS
eukprot:6202921-Pleurochrysis_carterae.AAC.5